MSVSARAAWTSQQVHQANQQTIDLGQFCRADPALAACRPLAAVQRALERLKLNDIATNGVDGDIYTGDKGSLETPDISGNLGGGVLKHFTIALDCADIENA